MENSQGALYFTAGVDLQKWRSDVEQIRKDILGVAKTADSKDILFLKKQTIADQKAAIKDIQAELKKVYDEAGKMGPGIAQATILDGAKRIEGDLQGAQNELKDLQAEYEALKSTMQSAGSEQNRLATKFNSAKNQLAELNLANKQGTAEYAAAEAEVKKYGQALEDANKRSKALTAGGIGALVQSLTLGAGVMSTMTALTGAFGDKNEELNKIMVQSQALLAATVTLQEIKNSVIQKGGIVSGVMAVQEMARARATSLATAGTLRATIAQRALNLVANANPYLLLATAIITVVGALALYISSTSKAAKTTSELNKKMAESAAEPIIEFKRLQAQWNALAGDLKGKEKFIKDNQDAFKGLGISVNNASDAENAFVKNSTAMVAAIMMRARAAAALELATEEYKKGLQKQLEFEQDEKILKTGSLGQKMRVRSGRNFDLLKGESLDGRDNINNANSLVNRSIAFTKSEQDFIIKAGIKPWEEIEKKKKTTIKKVTPEEILPAGSVAEIQKRLSAIDEALSKATGSKSIENLKASRIAVAEELAEAIKRIEIKSLEERAIEQEKYAKAYEIIAEKQGVESADKMYRGLMEGAQSYYGWLTNEQDKLFQKQKDGGILTEKDKENLVFLTEKINEIEGKKNAFENFTDGIDDALRKISTLSGQIEYLDQETERLLSDKGNKSFDNGQQAYLEKQKEERRKKLKETYDTLLKEQETYQEKALALQKEFEDMKNSDAYKNGSDADRAKINAAFSQKATDLFFTEMARSEEWVKVFTNMNTVASSKLEEFKRILQTKLSEAKTIEEKIKIGEFIQQIDDVLIKRNPLKIFSESIGTYIAKLQALKQAQNEYNAAIAQYGANSQQAADAATKLKAAQDGAQESKLETASAMADAAQEAKGYISDIQGIITDIQGAFDDLGLSLDNSFGDILDKMSGYFEGMQQQMDGMIMAAKGFVTGNPVAIIAGTIKAVAGLIKSIASVFNNDRKKEREIKKQAATLKELETAYNNLAFAAERAFGSQKYSGQRDLIRNLEQQKALLQGMLKTEGDKKKADKEKVAGYQSQIQSINQSIQSIKEGIVKDVLQTDVVDAAAKVGDALVDAFGRGEDAVESLEKAANDMIRNLLRNQLNLALQNKMKPILDQLLAASGFNQDGSGSFTGLTPEQIAAFKAQVLAAGQSMQGFLEAYSEIFEGMGDPQSLKGDIKGVTEKTAGALEAQINAMRVNQVSGLETMRGSLIQLVQIEYNTRNLIQIRQDISEMNSKIKRGAAGVP